MDAISHRLDEPAPTTRHRAVERPSVRRVRRALASSLPRSDALQAQRTRLAFSFLPGAVAGAVVAWLAMTWLMGASWHDVALRAWHIAIAGCIGTLALLYIAFGPAQRASDAVHVWGARYRIAVLVNGVTWGTLGLLLLRDPGSLGSALFPVLAGGLFAGAACALAPALPLFAWFTAPLAVGATALLAFDPTQEITAGVLLAVVYSLSALAAWRLSRAIGDGSAEVLDKERAIIVATRKRADIERDRAELLEELALRKRAQAELEANEVHFRALVETSGDIVWAVDGSGCCTYVNGSALESILGYRAEEAIGSPFTLFADPATAQAFDDEFFKLTESGGQLDVHGVFLHKNRRPVHLSISAIALHDDDGRFIGASGTAVDVSDIKAAEALLRQALAEQQAILNSATVGIAIVDNGQIVRANAEFEKMLGFEANAAAGMRICDSFDDADSWLASVESVVADQAVYDNDVTCRRRDGAVFWCRLAVRAFHREGRSAGTIWVVQDISDRKQKEKAIEYAAQHDILTGLPNRALLSERLKQAIEQADRANGKFGVLFIDLDRFKMVNDSVGHEGGDELLRVVAQRLRRRVRSATDTVARQGGDEFIVMLPDVRTLADVERVAEALLAEIHQPIPIFGSDYVVTGSIGITLYPDHGSDGQALLKHADAAMYRAKELGKNTYRVFTEDLHQQVTEDMQLENLLRVALDQQQLTVHYQPRIDLATGRVCSLEALARWQQPQLGWVEPGKFIAVAERAGLIGRLGEWVLRKACTDLSDLSMRGFGGLGLSVNVSHSQLSDPKLVANVRCALDEFGIVAERLELELTETAIARNVEQAITTMESLEATGIGVAIDDFGTGYSSLSQLKRFPIRTVKIDRSFISNLPHDEDDVAIALAVVAMAKRLKMRVVAEGVETKAQHEFLSQHECDEAQGFLFCRPLAITELIAWLNREAQQHAPRSRDQGRRVA